MAANKDFETEKASRTEVLVELSTSYTREELADAVEDEQRACYSRDGKRLFSGPIGTSYIIKEGTEVICDEAFDGAQELTSITIPSSVKAIGVGAFEFCSGLTSISLPFGLKSIGGGAFSTCFGLRSLEIPSSVTSIGLDAFDFCLKLRSIVIPSSVREFKGNPFASWRGKLRMDSPYFIYEDGVLYDRDKKTLVAFLSKATSYEIPSHVTCIGRGAFSGSKRLVSVTIPSSVTSIADRAFMFCTRLTSIEIPSSVTSIGSCAFYGCI